MIHFFHVGLLLDTEKIVPRLFVINHVDKEWLKWFLKKKLWFETNHEMFYFLF